MNNKYISKLKIQMKIICIVLVSIISGITGGKNKIRDYVHLSVDPSFSCSHMPKFASRSLFSVYIKIRENEDWFNLQNVCMTIASAKLWTHPSECGFIGKYNTKSSKCVFVLILVNATQTQMCHSFVETKFSWSEFYRKLPWKHRKFIRKEGPKWSCWLVLNFHYLLVLVEQP